MRDKFGRFIKGHNVPSKWKESSRKANKGKPSWNKGKKSSQETIEKLKSRVCSSETKDKIRQSVKMLWKDRKYRENMRRKHRKILSGRIKSNFGYILIYMPDHPFAIRQGHSYVPEHRLVMEKYIGRHLKETERVHHINKIKDDNRIENLKLFDSHSKHMKIHYPKGSMFGKNCVH